MIDLSIRLGSITFKNPILVAAGTFGYGIEFQEFFDLSRLGGLITKTLTLNPRPGNAAPRLVETPSGMLNAVGLQNVGIDDFLKDKWPGLRVLGLPIVVSIAGFSVQEFAELARRASVEGVTAIELNLSCPNVAHGSGARCFAQSADDTRETVRAAKAATDKPVWAKLSPEVSDVAVIARAAAESGADAISLINTMPGMVIDVDTERPVLANGTGGLSGPAIHPIAVRCVWEARQAVAIPVIGLGGVASGKDALELVLAGASLVAVGTANFWNPRAPLIILEELEALVRKKGRPIGELVGAVQVGV